MLLQPLMPLFFAISFNSFDDNLAFLHHEQKKIFYNCLFLVLRYGCFLNVCSLDGCFLDACFLNGCFLDGCFLDGCLLDGCFLNGCFGQVKIDGHFDDFEQVEIDGHFVDFGQVKFDGHFATLGKSRLMVILLSLDKSKIDLTSKLETGCLSNFLGYLSIPPTLHPGFSEV